MEFFKKEDVMKIIKEANSFKELAEGIIELKAYKAEYKPYMPIRIRDYGFSGNNEPIEYDCGVDQNHHWLQIEDDGSLRFTHMQCGAVTVDEKCAKDEGECCFIPTFETEDEFGNSEKYITPKKILAIEEDEEQ